MHDSQIIGYVLLALVLLLAGGGLLLLRAERQRRSALPLVRAPKRAAPASPPEPPSTTRHPIVLAHGFLGFDSIALGTTREEYFRGVRMHLEGFGHRVRLARVAPIAGIRTRAEQLVEQIAAIDAERVNIIAHSMGGLDARYAISRLGLGERVASLTTIGTPHHGTPLADHVAYFVALRLARRLMSSLGTDLEGIYDFSTERMRKFNADVPDAPGVMYASYSGWLPKEGTVHRLLQPTFSLMHRSVGNNDGIVPASSQRWGVSLGDVPADHWAQIGWSPGFDVKLFYAELARALARRGF